MKPLFPVVTFVCHGVTYNRATKQTTPLIDYDSRLHRCTLHIEGTANHVRKSPMSFRTSAFNFTRNSDPGGPGSGGDSLLSDMFSPSIPESLPSYPPSRRTSRFSFSSMTENKIQHLPPPPSPRMPSAQLSGYGNHHYHNSGYVCGNYTSNNVDIPSSPAVHIYSTPPTSRKSFKRFSSGGGVCRERLGEDEDDPRSVFGFNGRRSPPPLSTFYDGPLDGSLSLSLEGEQEEEEEEDRYATISNYRRDAGFKESNSRTGGAVGEVEISSGGLDGVKVGNSKKRVWASTLDDDEWYENGRGGLIRGTGVGSMGADMGHSVQGERGAAGGGKRRIIDVVGSVASRLWEAVKENASWGFYYPTSILKGGTPSKGNTETQKLKTKEVGEVGEAGEADDRRLSIECSRTLPAQLQEEQFPAYSYTNGNMVNSLNSTLFLEQQQQHDTILGGHSSLYRGSTLIAPDSPTITCNPRTLNDSLTWKDSANTVSSSSYVMNQDLDTADGLRASWVFIPQQEFMPTTATMNSSFNSPRPSSSRSHLSRPSSNPRTHARSASAVSAGPQRRPFRFPVKPLPTTANVVFACPVGGGRRSRKKSLSTGGTSGWGWGEDEVFGPGTEQEDEVDENMRRWNEKLREMIREGREALGSTVEVLYED